MKKILIIIISITVLFCIVTSGALFLWLQDPSPESYRKELITNIESYDKIVEIAARDRTLIGEEMPELLHQSPDEYYDFKYYRRIQSGESKPGGAYNSYLPAMDENDFQSLQNIMNAAGIEEVHIEAHSISIPLYYSGSFASSIEYDYVYFYNLNPDFASDRVYSLAEKFKPSDHNGNYSVIIDIAEDNDWFVRVLNID